MTALGAADVSCWVSICCQCSAIGQATGARAAAASIRYLTCTSLCARCAGNAPTLLSMADLRKVAPVWMNTSHAIFDDEEAHKVRVSC